jgi:hypothetical protein
MRDVMELGHYKQADAFSGDARDSGPTRVHDVFRHVMLTPCDENLGAKHLVAAVACGSARLRTTAKSLPATAR